MVNIHATTQLKVVLVKPSKYDEDATAIADHLLEKRTVVVNMENTDPDTARRLLDFVSGVAYATGGKVKRVAAKTYIATPYSVDLMGDLIDELENSGLYMCRTDTAKNGGIDHVHTPGSFRENLSQIVRPEQRLQYDGCGRISGRPDGGLYRAV